MTFPAQPNYDPAQQFQAPYGQPQFQAPPAPGFAPQAPAYAPQAPQAPQSPPSQSASSFSDFWDQRASSEGKAISFTNKPFGTSYIFQVTRPLTKGDIVHQTNASQVPQYNRDGSPKWVLVIPGRTPQGEDVTWWCKGPDKTALQTALNLAGATEPEMGSIIQVTYVRDKPNSAGYQPSKIKDVQYTRPSGVASGAAPTATQVADTVLTTGGSYSDAATASAQYAQGQAASAPAAPAPVAPAAPVAAPAPVAAAPVPVAGGPVQDPQSLFQSLIQG